jgi:hypothetical protein
MHIWRRPLWRCCAGKSCKSMADVGKMASLLNLDQPCLRGECCIWSRLTVVASGSPPPARGWSGPGLGRGPLEIVLPAQAGTVRRYKRCDVTKGSGASSKPWQYPIGGVTMRLTFLGKDTQGGGSPTLFATDRQTYVVQGCCAMRRSVVFPV